MRIDIDITLSKLDAAKRQLEVAVNLWFEEGDVVSIHTLAAAAHRVVHDVATHRGGGGAILLDHIRLAQWGYEPKAYKKMLRQAETFFKHAENDPDDICTISPAQTEFILASAIECFHKLVSKQCSTLALFMGWFHLCHPETLSEAMRNDYAGLLQQIKHLTRPEFRAQFNSFNFIRLLYPQAPLQS